MSQRIRKLLPQRSRKPTNTGSSEVGSAVLAAGKVAKQPVERSIKSEEAPQREIGVVKLDRLEKEEENTPEAAAALNGEGDISDEALDESDEGLLEHAINAGLLNDYDREVFRDSIARIERRPSRFVVE